MLKLSETLKASLIVATFAALGLCPWLIENVPWRFSAISTLFCWSAGYVLYLFTLRAIKVQILPTLLAFAGIQLIFAAPMLRAGLLDLLSTLFPSMDFLPLVAEVYKAYSGISNTDFLMIGTGLLLCGLAVYSARSTVSNAITLQKLVFDFWKDMRLPSVKPALFPDDVIRAHNALEGTAKAWGEIRDAKSRNYIVCEVYETLISKWYPELISLQKNPNFHEVSDSAKTMYSEMQKVFLKL